jgi:hypothetical protein
MNLFHFFKLFEGDEKSLLKYCIVATPCFYPTLYFCFPALAGFDTVGLLIVSLGVSIPFILSFYCLAFLCMPDIREWAPEMALFFTIETIVTVFFVSIFGLDPSRLVFTRSIYTSLGTFVFVAVFTRLAVHRENKKKKKRTPTHED